MTFSKYLVIIIHTSCMLNCSAEGVTAFRPFNKIYRGGNPLPRNKHPEETVQKILDVSSKLFLEKGYEQTTVLDIVNNLGGLTRGAFYHHFKSKEDVLNMMSERAFDSSDPFGKVKKDHRLNGLQKIQKAIEILFADTKQQDVNSMFMAIPLLKNPVFLADTIRSLIVEVGPILQDLIEEGIIDGSIPSKNAKLLSESFLLLFNLWMLPSVYPCTKQEYVEKFHFCKTLFENIGFQVFTDSAIKSFDNMVERLDLPTE